MAGEWIWSEFLFYIGLAGVLYLVWFFIDLFNEIIEDYEKFLDK